MKYPPISGHNPRARIRDYLGQLRQCRALTAVVTTHHIEEVENTDYNCIPDHGAILAETAPPRR